MTHNKKIIMAGLLFLCVESFLIDTIMDMQKAENAQKSRWNTTMIKEIDALANGN